MLMVINHFLCSGNLFRRQRVSRAFHVHDADLTVVCVAAPGAEACAVASHVRTRASPPNRGEVSGRVETHHPGGWWLVAAQSRREWLYQLIIFDIDVILYIT